MRVEEGDGIFSSTDFKLNFTHVADVLYRGSQFKASLSALGHFAVGDNMQGTCGGSGVCTWGLKTESTPVKIQPARL